MGTVRKTITIGSQSIARPINFEVQKDYIYAGEYVTCTGKRVGDYIGWRYSDITLEWDVLPQSQLEYILGLEGPLNFQFYDQYDELRTETVIPTSNVSVASRILKDGIPFWKNVKLGVRFVTSHPV